MRNPLRVIWGANTLEHLDIRMLANTLYPLVLSVVLGILIRDITQWMNPAITTNLRPVEHLTATAGTVLAFLYVLYDWDDCHALDRLDKRKTSADKLKWVSAASAVAVCAVLILAAPAAAALLAWSMYSIIVMLMRDEVVSLGKTSGGADVSMADKKELTKYSQEELDLQLDLRYYGFLRWTFGVLWSIVVLGLLFPFLGFDLNRILREPLDPAYVRGTAHLLLLLSVCSAVALKKYRKEHLVIPLIRAEERKSKALHTASSHQGAPVGQEDTQ